MACQWVSGNYKMSVGGKVNGACMVDGHQATFYGKSFDDEKGSATWEIGEFGEAHEAVVKLTGQKNNNIKMSSPTLTHLVGKEDMYGVINDDGKRVSICFSDALAIVGQYIWITDEEANQMRNSTDPVDSPTCHYKIQPENLGKFIWVSGPPGHGKSTTCKALMETKGFVYYEGDCFMFNLNPFIPPFDGEPMEAMFKQKALTGISKERSQVNSGMGNAYNELAKGEKPEILNQMYTLMSQDVDKQRKRIGGDWAVCQAVPFKAQRDLIRSMLGPDLVFVVLEMDNELGLERLRNRKMINEEMLDTWTKMGEMYEPATKDEENAIALKLTRDMSPMDVVEKILDNDLLKNNHK